MPRSIDRPSLVYLATNLVNGKRYLGVTSRPLNIRAANHWYSRNKRSGHALAKAMVKYGRGMFRFSILARCNSFAEALQEEIRLIALLKPEYNLTAGGDGGAGHCVPAHVRKLTSERMKKDGHKVWAASASAHRCPVICLKDGKIYLSGKDAAAAFNVSPSAMTLHLSGKNATVAGRLFAFYTGEESADPLHDEKISRLRQQQRIMMVANTPRRAVVCLTTGVRFDSLKSAVAITGVPYGCLSRIVRRRGLKSWHGLKFEYAK